ncbi:hypothetical protein, conserved [Babesia ovata]|uniref:Uncharacterized protein n=1 Tax=Babesia ovata TaxID=189622 RepID=A0A2H6KH07_9APIC|nr:uncharacterized protein BOVATA_037600 [Babesia ovata]GBE62267.1 hypothetical protein, conserved [Babesia ovata]
MVYDLLTTAPRNLKDAIDWLMAIKGTDSIDALGAAVHKVLEEHPVGFKLLPSIGNMKYITKRFLEQDELKGQWFVKELLKRFNTRMAKDPKQLSKTLEYIRESDYQNIVQAKPIGPEDVTSNVRKIVDGCEKFLDDLKNPDKYISTYSSKATWDASCSKYPEGCAKVLVGIAPMLYAGLRYLRFASNAETGVWQIVNAKERLGNMLKVVGYKESECRAGMSGSDILQALSSVDDSLLYTIYDLAGFWAFY